MSEADTMLETMLELDWKKLICRYNAAHTATA